MQENQKQTNKQKKQQKKKLSLYSYLARQIYQSFTACHL